MKFVLQEDEGDEDENEIPDDETINQMLARSEDDFETFQKVDSARILEESHAPGGPKPRLIEEEELPSWLIKDDKEIDRLTADSDEDKIFGRGTRQRKEVDYSEDLLEKQFIDTLDIEEEEEESMDSTEIRRSAPRKRRSRYEDDSEEEEEDPGPSRSRRRTTVLKQDSSAKAKEDIQKVIDILVSYQDSDGRILSSPFMKLPTRKELPDYYQVIRRPLDFHKIERSLQEGKYKSLANFESDLLMMCRNAQEYNVEGSLIYQDSEVLEMVYKEAKRQLNAGEKDIFIEPGAFSLGPPTYLPPAEYTEDENGSADSDDEDESA